MRFRNQYATVLISNRAKYGAYSTWLYNQATNIDANYAQEYEYYDYQYLHNRNEVGNDYSTTHANAAALLGSMASALGNGPMNNGQVATGLIASELMKPLQASGLTTYQAEAFTAYNTYIQNVYGSCPD